MGFIIDSVDRQGEMNKLFAGVNVGVGRLVEMNKLLAGVDSA